MTIAASLSSFTELKSTLARQRELVDAALDRHLPKASEYPRKIHEAMRYSVFAGGKRLRPLLVIAAAEACGGKAAWVLPTACAVEMIHTYSLIHDDLPAMDDDDLRRGRPTNHKVYGEGMAILAGDGLLTRAFEVISENASVPPVTPARANRAALAVARGAGTRGMVGGQVVDTEMDQGRWKASGPAAAKRLVQTIHEMKTSALITASLEAGAILVGATPEKVRALSRYGRSIGLAFQIRDDILDIVGDKKKLGKSGSDSHNQKITFPAVHGIERSGRIAESLIGEAKASLKPFGPKARTLSALADYILAREH